MQQRCDEALNQLDKDPMNASLNEKYYKAQKKLTIAQQHAMEIKEKAKEK